MIKDLSEKQMCVPFLFTKLRYKTTAKTVYDQPGSTLDQKDRD